MMSQLEDFLMGKDAEASGTRLMPNSPSPEPGKRRNPAVINKMADGMETTEGQSGEQYQKAPQQAEPKLRVDTTGKEAPTMAVEKKAQHYALASCGRYPLDSYSDVKTASAYYTDNWKKMAPVHRHEFCVNLAKRASVLGVDHPTAGDFDKYASETYGTRDQLDATVGARRSCIKEASHLDALAELNLLRGLIPAADFAEALGEFDKVASIDHLYDEHILDPYASTFGVKVAEETGSTVVGNDYLSHCDLKIFSRTNSDQLKPMFGGDFVDEFRKDPVAIFKSLPNDQKKVIIRLVNSFSTDPTPT